MIKNYISCYKGDYSFLGENLFLAFALLAEINLISRWSIWVIFEDRQ